MSRRIISAHSAYASRDTELSRAVHQSTELAELAAGKSDFLHGIPPANTFAVDPVSAGISGSLAASVLLACVLGQQSQTVHVVWVIGVLSTTAVVFLASWIDDLLKRDFGHFERSRERWEVANFPEGEIQEMIQIYSNYGVSDEDAENVARTLSKYPDFWIDHMLLHEIGIVPSSMRRENGSIRMTAICAFLGSFLLPSCAILFHGTYGLSLAVPILQTLLLVYMKSSRCQWLSNITALSIIAVPLLVVSTTAFIARSVLSIHSS